jgi:hypothetical protein
MPERRVIRLPEPAIHIVRGQRVMLDSGLASIYGVLTPQEVMNLKSQIAISSSHGRKRKLPWVFTEHGAIMLASILNSKVAIEASVRVVRAFVKLREMVSGNAQLATQLAQLERRLDSHDEAIAQVFAAICELLQPSLPDKKREIGLHVRERETRFRVRKNGTA